LSVLFFHPSFSQTAEELNQQSKVLLEEGKYQEALPVLRNAALLGSGEAQYNLGYFLQNGIIGDKNPTEAVNWYKKSSENNFNDGHYAMMMAYGNGAGIEQNLEKAFEYALKCAHNDDPTCIWNVVECYLTGSGVQKNIPQFKEWTLRLAKLQNPQNLTQSGSITSARLQLAHFHKEGNYFDKDLYQSYLWFLIYNEHKIDFSILEQNKVITEIKELEKHLSKTQIEKAKTDAEKLLGRPLTKVSELYKNSL
ncbi:MAG TPA: tetratricopeptide repeat protein, partial [Flavobacterium sp.]|nr:tetratricopeptide repeat protein [Flavobacterium sp.]